MYWYEKDYIMRLIHGIAQMLAALFFGRKLETEELKVSFGEEFGSSSDYLCGLVDNGEINAAENRLFELIDTSGMDTDALGSLILLFYDHVNSKDDAFLAAADFSRDEIIRGLEDAMKAINMEIPEYLRIG